MNSALDEAIHTLEELKKRTTPPDPHIFEQLDDLYNLRIEIAERNIERNTPRYRAAAEALERVIAEGREAMEDTGKIAAALRTADRAVGALKSLIDSVK